MSIPEQEAKLSTQYRKHHRNLKQCDKEYSQENNEMKEENKQTYKYFIPHAHQLETYVVLYLYRYIFVYLHKLYKFVNLFSANGFYVDQILSFINVV